MVVGGSSDGDSNRRTVSKSARSLGFCKKSFFDV